jgi:hypothetical protein
MKVLSGQGDDHVKNNRTECVFSFLEWCFGLLRKILPRLRRGVRELSPITQIHANYLLSERGPKNQIIHLTLLQFNLEFFARFRSYQIKLFMKSFTFNL